LKHNVPLNNERQFRLKANLGAGVTADFCTRSTVSSDQVPPAYAIAAHFAASPLRLRSEFDVELSIIIPLRKSVSEAG
jgi:hypothetical protein